MKQSFVGIDVSKNMLDVHVLPEDLSYSFDNEPQMLWQYAKYPPAFSA